MVSLGDSPVPEYILEPPQRHCVDEEQTIPQQEGQSILYLDCHLGPAVLGT